jgi:hypothetical protein
MGLIRWLKVTMGALLVALFVGLIFYSLFISATIALGSTPDKGATLIATMQDGDVSVYRLDEQMNCLAIVGELHGKTVSITCM